jgi:hypothetical protein
LIYFIIITVLHRREALFDQKLELCSHVFSFEDAASNKKEKEVKRQTLLELVDYVNTSAGQKIFTEASMPVCSHVLMPVDTPPVSRQL